jgi:hypothetical protein
MSDFEIEAKDEPLRLGNGGELPGRIGGFKY